MSKKGSHSVYLPAMLIDSVFKMTKNYNQQLLFEECKYVIKIRISKSIDKELWVFSEEWDEESSDKRLIKGSD